MRIGRLVLILGTALVMMVLSAAGGWFAFTHQHQLMEWLGLEEAPIQLSKEPLFKPLNKFVISLESEESSHYLMLELALVTHDPAQLDRIDNLTPLIRNAMVQFFSHRNLEQVRQDLQQIDALQASLLTKLSDTLGNYGYHSALDEVLVTKVVLQ